MVVYCWTLVPAGISQVPRHLGITSDRALAQRVAEQHLRSGEAFLALIEAVQPAMTARGLESCYLRTGRSWLGRRTVSGGVHWTERDPAALTAVPGSARRTGRSRRAGTPEDVTGSSLSRIDHRDSR